MNKKISGLVLTVIAFVFSAGIALVLILGNHSPSEVNPSETFYIGNLHTHTFASDGKMTYDEAIDEAKKLGFNFIAITDHNTISADVMNYCPTEQRIFCIIGEEVSSKEGHILAIGIKEPIPKGLTPEETIKKIHEQGGLAIPAHPGASNGLTIGKIKELAIDAVECSIRHKKEGEKYDCDSLPDVPHVYNSDAHKLEEISRAANKCLMPGLTLQNLIIAVKDKQCSKF